MELKQYQSCSIREQKPIRKNSKSSCINGNEMALCWHANGIALGEGLTPPPSARGRALVNWALCRIIGKWHSTSAIVPDVELTILEAGKFKRASGAMVTFALPNRIKTVVAKLRSVSNPRTRLEQSRRKAVQI